MLFLFNFANFHASKRSQIKLPLYLSGLLPQTATSNLRTTTSNCCLNERVQFFISSNCKLQVTGSDTLHLQVFGCISCQLKNLKTEMFLKQVTHIKWDHVHSLSYSLPKCTSGDKMAHNKEFLLWSSGFSSLQEQCSTGDMKCCNCTLNTSHFHAFSR